jgi:O-antigen/teichoic acid export membrane protein
LKRLTELLGSYIGSSGALLASSAAMLLTFGLLARHMGHEQFALNATITALTNLGVQICGLGSQESLVRRVAQNLSFYPEMLGHVHILNLVTGTVLILLGLVAIPIFFPVSDDPVITFETTGLILVTNIILLKIVWLATNSYIAHSNFGGANKLEMLFAGLRMLAAILACTVFGITTIAEWAVWNFAAHAIAAIAAMAAIARLGRPKFTIVREEIPLGLMFASQFFFKALRSNADILVLSVVAGSEVLGSYSIARRLMEASYMSVEALNRILYPGSAAAAMQGLDRVFGRAKRMLFVATGIGLASASFVWLITPLLPAVFGAEYVSLSWINRSLCWAVIPIAISAIAFEALGASSLQNIRAKITNISSLVGAGIVALAAWLIGIDGVIASFYGLEIIIAVLAWRALVRVHAKTSGPQGEQAAFRHPIHAAHAE